ncbi:MAG TPA: sodium pump decarboxylase, gamma subunit, partial [Lachnospiraceae bacterium]|nr:sodium pump decarboxylase, gamma subunit [Lachnospiraceae bacterium]
YENRKADLTLVFDEDGLVQSVTLDPEYTIAEILQKALMNTILGMGTVFVMLIFISLVIYCFNFIPNIQAALGKKAESEKKDEPEEEVTEPRIPRRPFKKIKPASGPSGFMADKELVAAITAAICAYEGTSSGGFVVRSIRRADASKWKKYN